MKFAVNTWQSDFKVNLHIRRVFLLTATKRYGRISIRRLIMLGPLFTRPYGQKIVKHCVQNFESCHIKSKILYPEHFKEKSTLENNIHRAKACSKIWEGLLLSENSFCISHRMVFGNHSIARSVPFKP